jgi:hypothetical protein
MLDFSYINGSPYFAGVSLLLLNIGSRYIMNDIGEFLQKILAHDLFKKIILFAMFFVATRDFLTSLTLTGIFIVIIYGFFNEKSKYSLVPSSSKIKKRIADYYTNIR